MATKPSKAQLAARKLFAQRAKAGTLTKNPSASFAAAGSVAGKRARNPAKKTAPTARKRNPLNPDVPGDFSQSSPNTLGRAWIDAKTASLKEYGDGECVVRLTWDDGEWLQMIYDTKAAALKNLTRLGFASK